MKQYLSLQELKGGWLSFCQLASCFDVDQEQANAIKTAVMQRFWNGSLRFGLGWIQKESTVNVNFEDTPIPRSEKLTILTRDALYHAIGHFLSLDNQVCKIPFNFNALASWDWQHYKNLLQKAIQNDDKNKGFWLKVYLSHLCLHPLDLEQTLCKARLFSFIDKIPTQDIPENITSPLKVRKENIMELYLQNKKDYPHKKDIAIADEIAIHFSMTRQNVKTIISREKQKLKNNL